MVLILLNGTFDEKLTIIESTCDILCNISGSKLLNTLCLLYF